MNDVQTAFVILFGAFVICSIIIAFYVYFTTEKFDKKKQQKGFHFNAWTGTWDTKEPIRRFK